MNAALNKHKSRFFLSMFICANYQRSFTLRYKSKMFSTLTQKGNTAFLFFIFFLAVLTSTYLQIGAIFGLFAMPPFVRKLFTGQCGGKECICVVKEAGWCPLVAKQHYSNILKDWCVVSTVTIYNTKGKISRLRILQHSASDVYYLFSEAEWWSSCFDSQWGTTPLGSWRDSSWFQAEAASSTQPLVQQKLLPVP